MTALVEKVGVVFGVAVELHITGVVSIVSLETRPPMIFASAFSERNACRERERGKSKSDKGLDEHNDRCELSE